MRCELEAMNLIEASCICLT